jgi:hypothetical protein
LFSAVYQLTAFCWVSPNGEIGFFGLFSFMVPRGRSLPHILGNCSLRCSTSHVPVVVFSVTRNGTQAARATAFHECFFGFAETALTPLPALAVLVQNQCAIKRQ